MDIFSLGYLTIYLSFAHLKSIFRILLTLSHVNISCVIAELFLEGTPIFSLSQLFKYRTGEYDPGVYLDKIEDPDIRVS